MASTIYRRVFLVAICNIFLTGFGTNTGAQSTNPGACPDKWKYYTADQTCLKIFAKYDDTQVLTWTESREACQKFYGGDLVQIRDEKKNAFVYKLVARSHLSPWIGIRNYAGFGFDFRYVNGSPVETYHPWYRVNPFGRDNNQVKCVLMSTWKARAGKWGVISCLGTQPYVCSIPSRGTVTTVSPSRTNGTTDTPSGTKETTVTPPVIQACPVEWSNYTADQTCLKVFAMYDYTKILTWNKSREFCQDYGGDLVQIRDEEKNAFVYKLVASSALSPWIGIRNHAKYGVDFRYVDGSPIDTYHPWAPTFPSSDDNGDVKCVNINNKDGIAETWTDLNCNNTLPYVCSIPSNTTGVF